MDSRWLPLGVASLWHGLAVGTSLLLGLSLAGCSSGKNMIDDNNPFYLHGLRLRQENKYEEAAAAFEKCLRFSPSSSKAELQLAMLYEDRLGDPVKAIEHYQAYLQKVPQGENSDTVRKWLARVERTYLQQLMDKYPEDVDILMGRNVAPGQNPNWTPRERALLKQVKRLNAEVAALRQALAKRDAGSAPGAAPSSAAAGTDAPGSGTAGVVPPPEAGVGGTRAPDSAEAPGPVGSVGAAPVAGAGTASGTGVISGSGTAGPGAASGVSAAPGGTVEPSTHEFVPIRRLTPGAAPIAGAALGMSIAAGTGSAPSAGASAAVSAAAPAGTYTVQRGDTLSSISRKLYGSVKFWTLLRDANQKILRGGTQVRAGVQLRVPPKPVM